MAMSLEPSRISKHMSEKLLAILPKVTGTHASSQTVIPPIDLSLAENLLLRDEFLAFFKDAIANDLKPKVKVIMGLIGMEADVQLPS